MRTLAAADVECYGLGRMSGTEEDPWRLAKALSGDEASWRIIIDEFSLPIWQWARSYGLTREEAEDVAQNVWYKLKDKGSSIQEPARLPGWLATTTKREALTILRRRRRMVDTSDELVEELHDPQPAAAELVEAGDMSSSVMAAFQTLSDACRQLLALCWSGNLTYEDIAGILGKSIGYIGPTRQRCLQLLRVRAGLT